MDGKWSWIRYQLTALSDMPSGGTRSVMKRGGDRLTAIEGIQHALPSRRATAGCRWNAWPEGIGAAYATLNRSSKEKFKL